MAEKPSVPANLQAWIDARRRYNLSHAHVQLARELGMNPKKLGGLSSPKQERWKKNGVAQDTGIYLAQHVSLGVAAGGGEYSLTGCRID